MEDKSWARRHRERFRGVLAAEGLDAILLANFSSHSPQEGDYALYYVSNLLDRYMNCLLLLTEDSCQVWVQERDLPRAREESGLDTIEVMEPGEGWGYSGEELGRLAAKYAKEAVGREEVNVGVNGRFLASSVGLALAEAGLSVEDVGLELEKARLVKDEGEVEILRRACQIVDTGVQVVMDAVEEGMTEHGLAALAEYEMRKNGADCFWWKTLMSSGPDAERWMASPTARRIKCGDLLVMDFTPVYRGYAGDIARTFVYGKASQEQLRVFGLAEKALEAASGALEAGVTYGQVMEAAAQEVRGTPYEEYYAGAGHGIGLYDDTYPIFLASLSQMEAMPASILEAELTADMAVAIEIIFTVPGLGGVRLEDNYVVTKDRPERLTHAPIVSQVS